MSTHKSESPKVTNTEADEVSNDDLLAASAFYDRLFPVFCDQCEKHHDYCECDDYAYLGTHSTHSDGRRPHRMGE